MKRSFLPVLTAVLVAGLALSGCSGNSNGSFSETTPAPVVSTPVEVPPSTAPEMGEGSTVQMLNALPVNEEVETGYDRDLFKHWVSENGTGCDTRVAVLLREAVNGTQADCVVSGTWTSLYDGLVFTDPGDLDIDHMVPLKEAWGSGAYGWDADTRKAYANDLEYPYSLIAVSASSNRAKSDQDPAEWMPSHLSGCEYVARWVGVKYRWHLAVDSAEKNAILGTLNTCGGDYIVGSSPVPVTAVPPAEPPAPPAPPVPGSTTTDPQFSTCGEAKSNGYGPYVLGQDEEYDWYADRDGDGKVCE